MSDEFQLQVRPKDADSSLSLANGAAGLVTRGLRDAEILFPEEPSDYWLPGSLSNMDSERVPLSEVRRRAQEGDMHARYALGEAYYEGHGVPKDYAEALYWFRKAADQFHLYANSNLGDMYEEGKGVLVDRAEALRYYMRAADIAFARIENDDLCYWDPDAVLCAIGQGAEHGHAKAQTFSVAWLQRKQQRNALAETRRLAEEGDSDA